MYSAHYMSHFATDNFLKLLFLNLFIQIKEFLKGKKNDKAFKKKIQI
jgi:hypothetical protein